MVKMLGTLYAHIWKEECVPMKWREGLVVSLFRKGIRKIQVIIEVLRF